MRKVDTQVHDLWIIQFPAAVCGMLRASFYKSEGMYECITAVEI